MMKTSSNSFSFSDTAHPSRYYSSEVGSTVPLIEVSSREYGDLHANNQAELLPQLPSHRYQYTIWHELRHTEVKGDQLRAPRVRDGPQSKLDTFYKTSDNQGELIHHSRKGKELVVYRNSQENWETATHVNLSHQELSHPYQRKNLTRILHRLKSAEEILLMGNELHDLRGITFPRCKVINLSKNYFKTFKSLPKMPELRHLILSYNQLADLDGLKRFTHLQFLELTGNGIYFTKTYRQRVFQVLPNLTLLDKTLRQEADTLAREDEAQQSSCMIM